MPKTVQEIISQVEDKFTNGNYHNIDNGCQITVKSQSDNIREDINYVIKLYQSAGWGRIDTTLSVQTYTMRHRKAEEHKVTFNLFF